MVSVLQPTASLIDPIDGVREAVEKRRWLAPLLLLMACMTFSAVAVFFRWDATSTVVTAISKAGELAKTTEQELAEQINQAERVRLVGGVAWALFGMPLMMLLIALALKVSGWLFEVRAIFAGCFAAACVAFLPIALYHFLFAVCVLAQRGVTDPQLLSLVPTHLGLLFPAASPPVARALSVVDFFNIWSAASLGLGFAAASQMRRSRAVILGVALYLLFAGVAFVGVPALSGGPS